MRLLGIDYGSKKIGLAISDSTGRFARPLEVVSNDSHTITKILEIITEQEVEKIVIGKSLNYRGQGNPILVKSQAFGEELAKASALPVFYENETLSSKEAERIVGRDKNYDARAAALILTSFIDKNIS